MNTVIQQFNFNGLPIAVIDHNNESWMTGDDIGKALEYNHPRQRINEIFDRNRDELEEFSIERNLRSTDGKLRDTRVYNEEGVMLISMFSNQPKAKAFRRWAVQVLKQHRQGHVNNVIPNLDQPLTLSQLQSCETMLRDASRKLSKAQVILTVDELKQYEKTAKKKQYELICERVKQGFTRAEISEELGITRVNVRQVIFHAHKDGDLAANEGLA